MLLLFPYSGNLHNVINILQGQESLEKNKDFRKFPALLCIQTEAYAFPIDSLFTPNLCKRWLTLELFSATFI